MTRIANRLVLLTTFVVGVTTFAVFKPQPVTSTMFEVRSPPEPTQVREGTPLSTNCGILVLAIDDSGDITLNGSQDLGTVQDTSELSDLLANIFRDRVRNNAYDEGMGERGDLPIEDRIQKIVFIRASPSLKYGDVLKVVDAVKGTGANPIVMQTTEMVGQHLSYGNLVIGDPNLIKPILVVRD